MQAAIPTDEAARLSALRSYQVLDTEPELRFDRLARIAAHIIGTPIALISLVDESRQFIKSAHGLQVRETSRDVSFCAHAILQQTVTVVPDATLDARFSDNELVRDKPGIRFYAGAPLRTKGGHALGALCCIDTVPHASLSEEQMSALNDLAAEVIEQLEYRNAKRELDQSVRELESVQLAMLNSPPLFCTLGIDLCFFPKHAVGGDFLCQFRMHHGPEMVLLTDVSGHDLKAAYRAAHAQGIVRGMLDSGVPLGQIFEGLNRYLLEQSEQSTGVPTSISALALVFDAAAKRISVLNFGSPAPVFVKPGGEACAIESRSGSPLGWLDQPQAEKTSFPADEGTVVVWTDGVEDLASSLGINALNLAIQLARYRKATDRPAWLVHAQDDVMAALIHLPGTQRTAEGSWLPLLHTEYGPEHLAQIDELQEQWKRDLLFAVPAITEDTTFDILLCTREAVLNALHHGCRPGQVTTLTVAVCALAQEVRITVSDPGPGYSFDPQTRNNVDLPDGHRGLFLIQQLTRRVRKERNGALIEMYFAI